MSTSRGALSPLWRFGGLLVLVVMLLGGVAVGKLLAPRPPAGAVVMPGAVPRIILGVLGLIVLFVAAAVYGIVLWSGCFTLDFRRPFIRTHGRKLWFADVSVKLLLTLGFTLMTGPTLSILLWQVMAPELAHLTAFFGLFVIAQLFLIWFQIWVPLDRILIVRRMRALGIPAERIATGLPIGTSNLDKKVRRWFRVVVEDDMGMMWFDQDRLVYFGDVCPWSIARDELLAIERAAMKSATSSYFGAVHVILVFRRPDGSEGRLRLHSQCAWTQTARARALDELADRLTSWKGGAIPLPPAIGFQVVAPAPEQIPMPLPDDFVVDVATD